MSVHFYSPCSIKVAYGTFLRRCGIMFYRSIISLAFILLLLGLLLLNESIVAYLILILSMFCLERIVIAAADDRWALTSIGNTRTSLSNGSVFLLLYLSVPCACFLCVRLRLTLLCYSIHLHIIFAKWPPTPVSVDQRRLIWTACEACLSEDGQFQDPPALNNQLFWVRTVESSMTLSLLICRNERMNERMN